MRIGIISDTHDNLPLIEKAVDIFNREKVGMVFHCGDFIAPFSLNALERLEAQWQGVFGNNDGEKEGLKKKSSGRIVEPPLIVEVDNRKLGLVHVYQDLKDVDCIFFGHTHKVQVEKKGEVLLLNPGETGAWLYRKSTLALLDLDTLFPEIVEIS